MRRTVVPAEMVRQSQLRKSLFGTREKLKAEGELQLTYDVQSRIWPQSDFSLPERLTTSLPERSRREVLGAGKDGGDREDRRTGTRISGEK